MGTGPLVKVMRKQRSDIGVMRVEDGDLIQRHSTPEPNCGCWLWTGNINKWGYGRLGRQRRERQAHRLSFLVFNGPIPEQTLVLHSCDVPCCVNPRHLRLGTSSDNVQDALTRKRHVALSGEHNPLAKLTREAVSEIRTSTETISALARRFGVSRRAVRFAKTGETWNSR